MRRRHGVKFIVLGALILVLFVLDLCTGSVGIPLREVLAALTGGECPAQTARIVIDIRLLKAVVAMLVGLALGVSGLQMQTLFRNPLAGPYVLGISSGAGLGVALFVLGGSALGISGTFSSVGIAGSAWLGAAAVLVMVGALTRRVRDIMVILILGMMLSSAISAVVQILQYLSDEQSLKTYIIWTMGSLGDVTRPQLAIFAPSVIVGLALAVAAVKPLNMLLFGEEYARTAGLDPRRARMIIFLSVTLLAGTVTAFCGPIGFIGLAIPHVARMLLADSDHRALLPGTILCGAAAMLLCDLVAKSCAIPVNSVTSLLGIPVVVWVVWRNKSLAI